jgi:transcriptional regulator with XRE-family HTH domain
VRRRGHPASVDRVSVGSLFRAIRIELRLRQGDVAERAGVSQQTVSRIECGRFGRISIDAYCRVAEAIGAGVRLTPQWRGAKLDRLLDRRHALLQNEVARLLTASGWQVAAEKSFNQFGDRGSVDVLAWRQEARALLLIEIKTEIGNLEETLRVLDMKTRVVPGIVRRAGEWQPRVVGTVLVLPDATAHRNVVAQHAATLSAALPSRTWDVRRWLAEPAGPIRGIWFIGGVVVRGGSRNVRLDRRVRLKRAARPGDEGAPRP